MTLISISNFFEVASLFIFATYFFKSNLNSFQCFAWAHFDLKSSILRRSVSVSALHVSCCIIDSVRVIFRDESTVWVLDVESDGQEEIDRVRAIGSPSVGFEGYVVVIMNFW